MKSVRYLRIEKRSREWLVERFAPAMRTVAEHPGPQLCARTANTPDAAAAAASRKERGGR